MVKNTNKSADIRKIVRSTREDMKEPILQLLLEQSHLTKAQLETLLIDLVIEDRLGASIAYEDKASLRTRYGKKSLGVTRGAFNRTLNQARRNITRTLYTMLLLGYLDLLDLTIFRPFEEIAERIRGYRQIREDLSAKDEISAEESESYQAAVSIIKEAVNELSSPVSLKSDISRRRSEQ